jgi:hypothetical protein
MAIASALTHGHGIDQTHPPLHEFGKRRFRAIFGIVTEQFGVFDHGSNTFLAGTVRKTGQ